MTAPDLSKRIVSARTMKALRQILLEPKYRLDKPGLPLCVWTDSESTLPAFLNQLGYRNVTHVTHLEQAPEPGLLICDGDHVPVDELKSLVDQLEQGEPILLIHYPVGRKPGDVDGRLDPYEIGKPRVHPIHRWYDVLYGFDIRQHIYDRPVVRVRRL